MSACKGPWHVGANNALIVYAKLPHNSYAVANCLTHHGQFCLAQAQEHARLIAEAGTVYHETGLTPRQLADQLDALKSTLHEEITANLAFREAGGARADEDMPTFCARIVAERAELLAAASRAEVAFNTVRGCYERNPGNFVAAMRELEADVIPLRAAIAKATGATP